MLYAASPEKWSFHSRGQNAGLLDPLFLNFLDPLGEQIPRDIRTRFGRYWYATECSWIINPLIYLTIHINISANLRVQVKVPRATTGYFAIYRLLGGSGRGTWYHKLHVSNLYTIFVTWHTWGIPKMGAVNEENVQKTWVGQAIRNGKV